MLQYSKTEKCSVYQQIFTILPFLPLLKKERKKKEKSTHDTTRHSILSDEKSIVDKTDVNAMIKYSRTGNHGRRFLDFAILVTRTGRRGVFKGLKRGNISSSADSLPGNLRFNCPPPWITRQKERGGVVPYPRAVSFWRVKKKKEGKEKLDESVDFWCFRDEEKKDSGRNSNRNVTRGC